MKTEKLLTAIGQIDDNLIFSAANNKKVPKRNIWKILAACAACLCLVIGAIRIFSPLGTMAVTAHAYGTEEEITAAGAIMSMGTISDTGEMTGHPLMFFLSGKDIATVRFSCKNQLINFMDWTEKRDEYGNGQNFTVPYGEDESEYYFLLIDWIPTSTIRELTYNTSCTISTLPTELREDIIVMEITFANGKTATKAIYISLQEDGTFFATFNDYTISKADSFINRPDSKAIPRDILYGKTELMATFYNKEQNEILAEALWYNMENIDNILVKWTGLTPNAVHLYYTPAGTETAEQKQLLITKIPLDGDSELTLSVANLDKTNMYGHLQIELDFGERKTTADYNVWYNTDNQGFSNEPETEDAIDAIFSTARNYYENMAFTVEEIALLEYSWTQATIEVKVSKNGIIQGTARTMILQLYNNTWKVINEGHAIEVTEMVFVMNKLYCTTGNNVTNKVNKTIKQSEFDSPYIGTIKAVVDFDEQPTEELHANFGSEGAEVVFYGDNIAVNISGIWIEFEQYGNSNSNH